MAARKTTRKPTTKSKPKASKATARPAGKARPGKAGKATRPAGKGARPAGGGRPAAKASGRGAAPRKRAPLKARRPALKARRPARKAVRVPVLAENPQALALARAIAAVAQEKKAHDVVVIDTRLRGAQVGYDYIVLASGDSDRQLTAIADAVAEALEPKGHKAISVEASAEWVLLNHGDVVAHFFTPDTRATYDLEGLWSDVPRVALEP